MHLPLIATTDCDNVACCASQRTNSTPYIADSLASTSFVSQSLISLLRWKPTTNKTLTDSQPWNLFQRRRKLWLTWQPDPGKSPTFSDQPRGKAREARYARPTDCGQALPCETQYSSPPASVPVTARAPLQSGVVGSVGDRRTGAPRVRPSQGGQGNLGGTAAINCTAPLEGCYLFQRSPNPPPPRAPLPADTRPPRLFAPLRFRLRPFDSMKFFSSSKRQTKKSHSEDHKLQDNDPRRDRSREDDYLSRSYPESSSPAKSPAKSLSKSKSASASPTKKSARPASPATPSSAGAESKRSSRHFARASPDLGKSSSFRRNKVDANTHPLNLPPDEIRRLSALSAMSARESPDRMDVDPPATSSAPSSPTQRKQSPPAPEPTPAQTPTPATNGSSSPKKEDAPAPPPHTTDPNSPPPTPADEAEVFKTLGNKFFKEKNYKRAIDEYSKGMRTPRQGFSKMAIS